MTTKTYDRYSAICKQHISPDLGHLQLSALRPLHIQAAYTKWSAGGRHDKRKGGLSAKTVVHHHRVLRQALKTAVKWQLLGRNVAEAVDPPRIQKREMQALDNAQISKLLTSAESDRLYAPILVAIAAGLRRGDLLALRWSDVNFAHATVSVSRSLGVTRSGMQLTDTKTARSRRAVKIPKLVLQALERHKADQEKQRKELAEAYHDQDLVFPAVDGAPWHPDAFSSAYRTLAGGKIRLHDLRHTATTLLVRGGVHPKIIADRLGHATTRLTLDTYSHVLPGMDDDAVRKIDQQLRDVFKLQRLASD